MKFKIFLIFILFQLSIYAKEIKVITLDKEFLTPLSEVKITVNDKSYLTDKNGICLFTVNDNAEQIILKAELKGYKSKIIKTANPNEELIIKLELSEILSGEEIVIEGEKIFSETENTGKSVNIKKNDIKNYGKIGLIEDLMSSVKLLQGVSPVSGFDNKFSIRGSAPEDFSASYDGFILRNPFHWNGVYSIFNPNIVESAGLSHGVFSVKYGNTISGLLEVETNNPDDTFKSEILLSTSTVEGFIKTPLGSKKSGIFLGGRFTFSDLAVSIYHGLKKNNIIKNDGTSINVSPFIRDGYLKWFYKPDEKFYWYINGFFGSDGIGINYSTENLSNYTGNVDSSFNFKWQSIDAFGVIGFKILPSDKVFIHTFFGYEFLLKDIEIETSEKSNTANYPIDNNTLLIEKNYLHGLQNKIDVDIIINEKVSLNIGGGSFYDILFYKADKSNYIYEQESNEITLKEIKFKINGEYKNILKTFLYISFNFDLIKEKLKMEVGCRVDHGLYLAESFDSGFVNIYPAPSPRINLIYTPIKNILSIEHLNFSLGAGLFSKIYSDDLSINGNSSIAKNIEMTKAFTTIAGFDLKFKNGINLKTEGYYKFFFNRMYINEKIENENLTYIVHTDGLGQAAGFDIQFLYSISKYFSGLITYSFIYAKYFNPISDNTGKTDKNNEPAGIWYFPNFHRMHILNIACIIKPSPWMSIIPIFNLMTGKPVKASDGINEYDSKLANGSIIKLYGKEEYYSDMVRSDISIPFSLKISFNTFFPKSKIKFEAYIAAEDIFAFLYVPKKAVVINKYTGEETPAPEANFSLGIPIPSAGIKISF